MNVKLTTAIGKEILINWNNVDFVRETSNHFGENYTEVDFGDHTIEVKEPLQDIEILLHTLDRAKK
ncbi:hypothetical protein CL634_08785 [bacterium]|nr:hypothetical protein [bacterium]